MKNRLTKAGSGRAVTGTTFRRACRGSCQSVLAKILAARKTIVAETREGLQAQEQLLQLVLNEAEALAWQTGYPHLVFPALAREKVEAVARWNRHQQFVRQITPVFAPAE